MPSMGTCQHADHREGVIQVNKYRFRLIAAVLIAFVVVLSAPALALAATGSPGVGVENDLYQVARSVARTAIWNDINTGKAGSATVAILDGGEIVYAEGFAMADREQSVPVDPATVFNIGSISKVYAATAVMLLVDAGKVDLDAPVTRYLPEFIMDDPRYTQITVRMLLNHTSGMPGTVYTGSFGLRYNDAMYDDTLAALSHSRLKHDPGAAAAYCNDGFTLAEMIVARVSGQRYLDFLADHIFKPLALDDTAASVGDRALQDDAPGAAAAYYRPMTGQKEPLEAVSLLGSGGLSSTAVELVRFVDSFSGMGKQIMSQSALAEMKKSQPPRRIEELRNPGLPYGLGWDMTYIPRYQKQGIQVLGKSGGTGHYNSMVYTVPDERISVAVIETGPGGSSLHIALDVLDAVLVAKGLIAAEAPTVSVPPAAQPIPDEYAAYCGYYISDAGTLTRVSIDSEADCLCLSDFDGDVEVPAASIYYDGGTFHTGDSGGPRFYLVTIDGEQRLMAQSSLGFDTIAMRRLPVIEDVRGMELDMDDRIWLRRNGRPFESALFLPWHLSQSHTFEDLPGYVSFNGMKKIESSTYAAMPDGPTRDITDLRLLRIGGEVWAQVYDMLYSPVDCAVALAHGVSAVTIGGEGYSEWLRVEDDSILTVQIPASGRVIIFASDGSPRYDSAIDEGGVFVEDGDFVELCGMPGDQFMVTCEAAR